jgi:hypothetical protein
MHAEQPRRALVLKHKCTHVFMSTCKKYSMFADVMFMVMIVNCVQTYALARVYTCAHTDLGWAHT